MTTDLSNFEKKYQMLIFCQNLAKIFNQPLATFLKHAWAFLLLIIHKNATKNIKPLLVLFLVKFKVLHERGISRELDQAGIKLYASKLIKKPYTMTQDQNFDVTFSFILSTVAIPPSKSPLPTKIIRKNVSLSATVNCFLSFMFLKK